MRLLGSERQEGKSRPRGALAVSQLWTVQLTASMHAWGCRNLHWGAQRPTSAQMCFLTLRVADVVESGTS